MGRSSTVEQAQKGCGRSPWQHRRRSWSITPAGQGCGKGSPGSSTHLFTFPFFCQRCPPSRKVLSSGQASSFSFYSPSCFPTFQPRRKKESGQAAPACQEGMSHVGIRLGPPFTHGFGRAVPTPPRDGTHSCTRAHTGLSHAGAYPCRHTHTEAPDAHITGWWKVAGVTVTGCISTVSTATSLADTLGLVRLSSRLLQPFRADLSGAGRLSTRSLASVLVAANCQDCTCPALKMLPDLLEAATSLSLSFSGPVEQKPPSESWACGLARHT